MLGITVLGAVMAAGIVAIVIFGDAMQQRGNIILFTGTMTGVISPLVGYILSRKLDAVHLQVNGKMQQLIDTTAKASKLEGNLVGLQGQVVPEVTTNGTEVPPS